MLCLYYETNTLSPSLLLPWTLKEKHHTLKVLRITCSPFPTLSLCRSGLPDRLVGNKEVQSGAQSSKHLSGKLSAQGSTVLCPALAFMGWAHIVRDQAQRRAVYIWKFVSSLRWVRQCLWVNRPPSQHVVLDPSSKNLVWPTHWCCTL